MTSTITKPEREGEVALPGRTSVGKKFAVAATGLFGILFLIAHMAGNLHAFQGPHQIDHYGEGLRTIGEPFLPRSGVLWLLRVALILAVTIHITFTVQLALQSRKARPVRYVKAGKVQASTASKTMRWGGLALFLFIIFHLMDLSWGVHPHFIRGAVYHNLVVGFRRPVVVGVYIVAMGALAMHVYHGTWSTMQTLGVNQARWDRSIRRLATALSLLLFVGFISVPVGVLVHLVK